MKNMKYIYLLLANEIAHIFRANDNYNYLPGLGQPLKSPGGIGLIIIDWLFLEHGIYHFFKIKDDVLQIPPLVCYFLDLLNFLILLVSFLCFGFQKKLIQLFTTLENYSVQNFVLKLLSLKKYL